jgi:glycosyltransferase involved in cell wall biosynthesis
MSEKIGVLFLHSQDGFGADSAIHADLMRYLDRDRFVVHVACSRGDGTHTPPSLARIREIPDIRLLPTHFAPGFRQRSLETVLKQFRAAAAFPLDFAKLMKYVQSERIHVIHGTDRPRDATYAVALATLTGRKSIVHVHVAWSERYSAPAKWAVRRADGVFAISDFVTNTVVSTGTPRHRVHTILNGIDLSRWTPGIDGSGIRREFKIPPNAPLLATVSRLFGAKGHWDVLHALPRVCEAVPDVRWLIVGTDAVEVHGGSLTAELKVRANQLGLGDRIVFAGQRSDIPKVMAACDVFTMPSLLEPFGLVFLEAMAMERPVLAVDDGGTPEVVEHGRCGLLTPPGDVDAIAESLVTLLRDPQLRARMGAYGRARVLAGFTAQRMARDAGQAYEAVLNT